MLSPSALAEAFSRNVELIKLQTAGLTDEESLIQLPFRANCMNWIVGHLVTNRNTIFRLLQHEELIERTPLERYERESGPISGAGDGVLPLEQLLGSLEQAQSRLRNLLGEIEEEELARSVAFFGKRSMPVAEWLFFFYFHDTYHTGQTEILRQAAGKDDKVI